MISKLNQLLDHLSDFFAHRKGLLPSVGILFILVNYVLQFLPGFGWISESDLLLHIGVVLAIIGFLLAWAL